MGSEVSLEEGFFSVAGTIMPWPSEKDVPEDWHELDGSELDGLEYPNLLDNILSNQSIWEAIGGDFFNGTIILPDAVIPELPKSILIIKVQ